MADIESLNHTGISVPDVRSGTDFYDKLLGAQVCNVIGANSDEVRRGRGVPHPCILMGDYAMVVFVNPGPVAIPEGQRGLDGSRRAFAVPRARFSEIVERARANGIAFEGPAPHPENGPLGESIYLTDPGGNFFEICWRRDEGRSYQPSYGVSQSVVDGAPQAAPVRPDLLAGVIVEVADLSATRAFYGRIFQEAPGEWQESAASLRFRSGAQTVEFLPRAEPRNRAHAGEHQAYRVGSGGLQRLADELAAAGHTVNWWKEDHPAERAATAYVDDPSGNRVQLVASDPREVLLDHVGVAIHEMEEAETFYLRALGGAVDHYHGWRTEDVLEAKAAGVDDLSAAPWTRRATMSFRTHQPEPLPSAQLFLAYGGTRLDVILTAERIPELPEEIVRGTPRLVLRTRQRTSDVVLYLSTVDISPVFMKHPRRPRFERDGSSVFLRDPSGNFVELACATTS